ncbi:MAG: AI-2E family transporter [Chloroflexota bacterium]
MTGSERRRGGGGKLLSIAIVSVVLIVVVAAVAYQIRQVLLLALISALLAIGLQRPVDWLAGFRVPRPLGLLAVYVSAGVFLVGAGMLLLPPVFRDVRALARQAPAYLDRAQAELNRYGLSLDLPAIEEIERKAVAEVTSDFTGYLSGVLSVLNFTFGLLGGVLTTLLVLVLSIFIVMEGPAFRAHVLSLLPPEEERRWARVSDRIARKIQGWMLGTFVLALIIGAITTLSLSIIGIPYAFLLGLIAGIGEVIPMLGPIVAAVPAVGVAAFYGWAYAVGVLLLYIGIQQVENYLLVPRVMGTTVELPGIVVLLAFLIGSELGGVVGAILATPVAATCHVLWQDWAVPSIRARTRPLPAPEG